MSSTQEMSKLDTFTLRESFCRPPSKINKFFAATHLKRWDKFDLIAKSVYDENPVTTPQEVFDIYVQSLVGITKIDNISRDVVSCARKLHNQITSQRAQCLKTIGDTLLDIRRGRAAKRRKVTDQTQQDFKRRQRTIERIQKPIYTIMTWETINDKITANAAEEEFTKEHSRNSKRESSALDDEEQDSSNDKEIALAQVEHGFEK
ncbi:hypothetical protein BC936DRAFT_142007 [Jimgerdemannia flammicorona]|uniref:Uncharacterized protein n=1 Tax=Jimgerdemannia flammicorona TaxID=994334 RepID=A0A433DMF4_9FUNG|nr:hypothetical protein BC936DRAFT_142007 [Jimgerdemannia flammicorona]